MKRLTILCTAGLLAACSQTQSAQTAAGAAVALTVAEATALHYVTLPVCPSGSMNLAPNGTLCSQPSITGQIKVADNAAFVAVKAAEADPTAVGAAYAAIAALTTLTPPSN